MKIPKRPQRYMFVSKKPRSDRPSGSPVKKVKLNRTPREWARLLKLADERFGRSIQGEF